MPIRERERTGLTRRQALGMIGGVAGAFIAMPNALAEMAYAEDASRFAAGSLALQGEEDGLDEGALQDDPTVTWQQSDPQVQEDVEARIASLEAEIAQLQADNETLRRMVEGNEATIAELDQAVKDNAVVVGDVQPENVKNLWVDTGVGGVLKYHDGSNWTACLSVWG